MVLEEESGRRGRWVALLLVGEAAGARKRRATASVAFLFVCWNDAARVLFSKTYTFPAVIIP
jgi:hypothetical protein